MNAVTKIEAPGIHAAIAAAMGEIQRIGKSERNSHGNYNFAGIDAFLDLTRPICAKHGLNVLQDEEGFEVFEVPSAKGPQKMLLMRFAFTVAREGEAIGPLHRSIMVPASMGSQAFGSAQSYALKQFLRSLFQISTGEKDQDIDAHDTGELATYSKPAKAPPAHSALKTKVRAFVHSLEGCGDASELDGLLYDEESQDLIAELKAKIPSWWEGGEGEAPEFIPLKNRIDNKQYEFARRVADNATV